MVAVSNHRATMASRIEDPSSLDYFPSPPWWGRALGEALVQLGLPLGDVCHEPAAGEGHLAHGLSAVFDQVWATDIHAYPRRPGAVPIGVRDYLEPVRAGEGRPDWTATNPPFGDKTVGFIRHASARSMVG